MSPGCAFGQIWYCSLCIQNYITIEVVQSRRSNSDHSEAWLYKCEIYFCWKYEYWKFIGLWTACCIEVAHVANFASKAQLLLFQSQIFLLLVSHNFFLVQQKWDTKSKEEEAGGEVEDIYPRFYICLKFDIFLKFIFSLNLIFLSNLTFLSNLKLLSNVTFFSNYMLTLKQFSDLILWSKIFDFLINYIVL